MKRYRVEFRDYTGPWKTAEHRFFLRNAKRAAKRLMKVYYAAPHWRVVRAKDGKVIVRYRTVG